MKYDFAGWATRANIKCADGRIIMRDAFKDNDGDTVPLVWNHQHDAPDNVLGHALLENREDGVYAYCSFNDNESGEMAKTLVKHGDICALSIYANKLKQNGAAVLHGAIREVSLVLAGANPGAHIEAVLAHGEASDEEAVIYNDSDSLELYHADKEKEDNKKEETEKVADDNKKTKNDDEETVQDVVDSMTEKQKNVLYALVGAALQENGGDDDDNDEEEKEVKHNLFDNEETEQRTILTREDQAAILDLAKQRSVGTLQHALQLYAEENDTLAHGIDDIETLFPDYKDLYPGAPEKIERDQGWVSVVMNKANKSPISRVRTRQADIRDEDLRAMGYIKGKEKSYMPNIKLLKRTTDPQTVYVKDKLDRDDIIDITDFDVVEYMRGIMRQNLNEEIARAALIGDGRDDGDDDKIFTEHIRPIWTDDELYCIHADVDIDAARKELQGSNTSANFGENYIYAEAIITAALYARENYKGKGTPDFFCTPHLRNVMLLARDLNGRRIYNNTNDLAAALDVGDIYTVEQFENKTRKDSDGNTKQLLGIFVNMDNYTFGATKGGEVTSFNQFDIDFNQEKYLTESRLSGALTRVFSAIALEEPVSSDSSTDDDEETAAA